MNVIKMPVKTSALSSKSTSTITIRIKKMFLKILGFSYKKGMPTWFSIGFFFEFFADFIPFVLKLSLDDFFFHF